MFAVVAKFSDTSNQYYMTSRRDFIEDPEKCKLFEDAVEADQVAKHLTQNERPWKCRRGRDIVRMHPVYSIIMVG